MVVTLVSAGQNELAIVVLSKAVGVFQKVTKMDCTNLIDGCNQLISIGINMCEKKSSVNDAAEGCSTSTSLD